MIHRYPDAETLLRALADFVVEKAEEAIRANGRFSFVLSGGSSPKKLFEKLASDEYRKRISWSRVFFFFGDERYVPKDHADSNYRMAKVSLLDPLQITPGQVYRMNTDLPPADAALAYENDLRAHFESSTTIRFDLVLLGLGDDAHTASLFPHTPVLHEKEAMVKAVYVDKVGMFRITLTALCINNAANIAFLVYGASKSEALHHVLEGAQDIDMYPAQSIRPAGGSLHWFIDTEAAKNLQAR